LRDDVGGRVVWDATYYRFFDESFNLLAQLQVLTMRGMSQPGELAGAGPLRLPLPFDAADVNCDGAVDIIDVVTAVGSAFRNGPRWWRVVGTNR